MVDNDKFNLMEISVEKLEQRIKNESHPDIQLGVLYSMPVVLRNIGKNDDKVENIVSSMAKYNHPTLSLNYGYMLDKDELNPNENVVYIVRELVRGKNFHSIFNYHIHDRLVFLYKIICLLEFLHSFDFCYIFLHPNKLIITDEVDIKLIDHIKMNDEKLLQFQHKSGLISDEERFISPELYKITSLLKCSDDQKKKFDLYSFGCLFFYAVTGELPWGKLDSVEKISEQFSKESNFLEFENNYPESCKKLLPLISNILSQKLTTEEVRLEMEKFQEIIEYNKDAKLMFDFEGASLKVLDEIADLMSDIDKLYDDYSVPRDLNKINQSNLKLKFTNDYTLDFSSYNKKL